MERKLIFFDIDGTLITEDERRFLPESARKAIFLARKHGHLVFINTGRVFVNLDSFIQNIGFDGYVCGCGTYIRYQEQVLFHHRLSKAICKTIALLARKCSIYSLFEAADHNAIDFSLSPHKELARLLNHFANCGHPITMSVDDSNFSFDKMTVWHDEKSNLERFKKGLEPDFIYIHRGEAFGEIVPKRVSKATGIAFLQNFFDIPLESCFAFGDGPNDLSMLQYVPNSIGMGNGSKEVLRQVSYITNDILNDGVWHALKHFNII